MKINPINQQRNIANKGKIAIKTNTLSKNEIYEFIKRERFLADFAKDQRFDYLISRSKKNQSYINISIVDENKQNKFFKYKETLSTKINNTDELYNALKLLTNNWENKKASTELSFKEKFLRGFGLFPKSRQI